MRVPLDWLKQYTEISCTAEELAERLTMGGLEVEGIELERTEERPLTPVLDVYITPNRGDCLSMAGVAREAAALMQTALHLPSAPVSEAGGEIEAAASVQVDVPHLCPRYAARVLRGIRLGPSPPWMQQRLLSAGQRPINNVVDVTNYVMLELGQPLHAFDMKGIAQSRIVVRTARIGERITTLDGAERTLTPEILVIADAEKPIAVAGLMGGADSEVADDTTDILLESAHFNPQTVRRACKLLNLRTEASYRFERTVDEAGVLAALERACELLQEMGQPAPVAGHIDVRAVPDPPIRRITLRPSRVAALLGIPLEKDTVAECLQRVGVKLEAETGNVFTALLPTWRTDLQYEEDLVEEVGRIYGYENIPEVLPAGSQTGGDSDWGRFLAKVRQPLAAAGMQEVVTHSLTGPTPWDDPADAEVVVPVRNSLSGEVSRLRRSLLPGLLQIASYSGTFSRDARWMFEIGQVWQMLQGEPAEFTAAAGLIAGSIAPPDWRREQPSADFAQMRGVIERLLDSLGIEDVEFARPSAPGALFHPGRAACVFLKGELAGVAGELHPQHAQKLPWRERVLLFELSMQVLHRHLPTGEKRFVPLPRFPAVVRDLAPRISAQMPWEAVETALKSVHEEILEEWKLTDLYKGAPLPEDVCSPTISFTFRSKHHTLTDAEVNATLEQLQNQLRQQCGARFAGEEG